MCSQDREIEPYRKERQQRKQATTQIKSLHADVQFRSEEELEAAIRAADYRMTHESISKAEENALFKQIQKLQVRDPVPCCFGFVCPHGPCGEMGNSAVQHCTSITDLKGTPSPHCISLKEQECARP